MRAVRGVFLVVVGLAAGGCRFGYELLPLDARSAAWIRAEYRSMLPGAVKLDAEQSRP